MRDEKRKFQDVSFQLSRCFVSIILERERSTNYDCTTFCLPTWMHADHGPWGRESQKTSKTKGIMLIMGKSR